MANVKQRDYVFLSTLLRAREPRMLNQERLDRMLNASDFDEAAKILMDCGYPDMSGMTAEQVEAVFAARRVKLFDEIEAQCPEPALLQGFRLKYDYHNIKALVKSQAANVDATRVLSPCGRVKPEALTNAVLEERWADLPADMAAAIAEAQRIMDRTANPQLMDFALDKAYFAQLLSLTEGLYSPFYLNYARLQIDCANLRSTVRAARLGRDVEFLKLALIPGGQVDVDRIVSAGDMTLDCFASEALLAEAVSLGRATRESGSLTAFEKACDNALNQYITRAKLISLGSEAVVAFIANLDSGIVAARILLTGKRAGDSGEAIRERLRETYE